MKIDVTVPELAESISEAVIGEWLKKPGELVQEGDQLVDIETDKVILEVTAPKSGELAEINKNKNEQVQSNEIIAVIDTNKAIDTNKQPTQSSESASVEKTAEEKVTPLGTAIKAAKAISSLATATVSAPAAAKTSPSVRKLAVENNIDIEDIKGSGKDGRILKQDIESYIEAAEPASTSELDVATEILSIPQFETQETQEIQIAQEAREDKRVPMTSLRKSIARRLVSSQQETAMLTTFNEVNMQSIISLRQRHKESFEQTHGVKLGSTSFFILAAVGALKEFPAINASIEGDDIVYHNYFDIGIAVSTPRGLIVPIIRDADGLSFADVEKGISDFAVRARENKVTIEELTGGTFTITNGGVFGSMMSTPIINPPQSAILGMHATQARPIAQNGNVVIAPMMYLALSYDHRIIDGREAVQFLMHIKNTIEYPTRLLLQV